jgi:hypothetical protein
MKQSRLWPEAQFFVTRRMEKEASGSHARWHRDGLMRRMMVVALLLAGGCATGDFSNGDSDMQSPAVSYGAEAGASDVFVESAISDALVCATGHACFGACVDTTTDSKNCGACGKTCAFAETCQAGVCILPCPAPTTACDGVCVDTSIDLLNCGKCKNACPGVAAATCASGVCTATLRVLAFVDGVSDLIIAGPTVRWHHVSAVAPGLWNGHDDPTYLNTLPWRPAWPNSGDNRDCNCDSQPVTGIPPLAARAQTVSLEIVSARGSVAIMAQPSSANGYTATVEVNDTPTAADWYEFVLRYGTQ